MDLGDLLLCLVQGGPAGLRLRGEIGAAAALLADKYGLDAAYAGELVLVTTLCSMITLPLWSFLCLWL